MGFPGGFFGPILSKHSHGLHSMCPGAQAAQRARAAGTRAPRVYVAQPYLYVLQPGVETAASPTFHPAVQLLLVNISQVQITNHSKS